MDPQTVVASFDVGEQVVPVSIPSWAANLVHEFGFDRAEAALVFARLQPQSMSLIHCDDSDVPNWRRLALSGGADDVASFDVGEQVVPVSIPSWVANLVHEFGFDRAEAAFHRCIVPAISLPAHGLNHPGRLEDLAVISGSILASAIGVVNEPSWWFLPLDGHG